MRVNPLCKTGNVSQVVSSKQFMIPYTFYQRPYKDAKYSLVPLKILSRLWLHFEEKFSFVRLSAQIKQIPLVEESRHLIEKQDLWVLIPFGNYSFLSA